MGLVLGTRRGVALAVMSVGLAVGSGVGFGQSVTLMEPEAPLLPAAFGEWKQTADSGAAKAATLSYSLLGLDAQALGECGERRSKAADYTRGGRVVHVEAIQFGDRTGAYSAFTLAERPGMRVGSELGTYDADAVGGNAVLFTVGKSLVMATFGGEVTEPDVVSLRPLAQAMPKVFGGAGAVPILPTLPPAKGLVGGSLRYALGPVSYAAEGGVLPAASLNWKMEPEAVTVRYDDERGKETLTLLLYPTPQISGEHGREIVAEMNREGTTAGTVKLRREGPLLAMTTGAWTPGEAQKIVEGVHLHDELTWNKPFPVDFHSEVRKTASLLSNILILTGVLFLAAVILALFFGGGRALIRVLQGKPAATEPEFLHIDLREGPGESGRFKPLH